MQLVTVIYNGVEQGCITTSSGNVLIATVNHAEQADWPVGVFELLATGQFDELKRWYNEGGRDKLELLETVQPSEARTAPLYRHPRKIWGIGMNYVKTAEELTDVAADADPVSFMKPDTTLIGGGDAIVLPVQSERVTAEAELAIIIGHTCKNITEAEAPDFVAGFAVSNDVTAADIHAKHQRYLTRAKSFDTFFSFGSQMITTDEIEDVHQLQVETWQNGELKHRNSVSNMIFKPWYLVAYHSQVMTLLPGDVILSGTPGSVIIRSGDVVECRIDGFTSLVNSVI
ncbi:MAG: fumarylacetoacetate hydrolase family protein [Candidatus Pristimantibacillus sp.]